MTGASVDSLAAPLLRASDLRVALDSEAGLVRALDGIDIAIERGQTFALVGESGCGKSMTALTLMRLLPDNGFVTQGSVLLAGEDLLLLSEARMRERRGARIGIIFQDPSASLNPVLRIGAQIVEVIETHTPLRGASARNKALEWLRLVGIPEPQLRIDSYPFQISGGQKQRVMIAIALAAEPDLLIADEPTTALDVTIQAQILDLLKDLQGRLGMGLLLITHDLGVVARMAHRVALMYAGQIVEEAEAAEFFARPLHPYARELLRALPDGAARELPLATIAGSVPPLYTEFVGCRFAERCPRVMPQCPSRAPLLEEYSGTHAVRCLLYSAESRGASDVVQALRPARSPRLAASPAGASPILEVTDLKVYFPVRRGLLRRVTGYVKAVDGVSFSVQQGHTLALVGESGCGKTTIGKALVQLLRRQALIDGQALLAGQELGSMQGEGLRHARRTIQIIFQDPFASLNPRMRVMDLLEEGMVALRPEFSRVERRERIVRLLDRVGMRGDALDRYPHEFSGGQRQRLAIARALAVDPRLIVCDEPTSALDVSVQAQILNLLRELQDELGVAYLFITHNIGVVEYLADELAVMRAGRIVEAGPAPAVLGQPRHEYTRRLLAAVPRLAAPA